MKVNIYNINYEVNAEIVQKSKSLNEYSRFIGKIKENLADGLTLEEAIQQAIEYGIEHDVMREFLEANGTEVANMLLSGWNMDEALIVSKEEGFEDGYEKGYYDAMHGNPFNNSYKGRMWELREDSYKSECINRCEHCARMNKQ